MPEPQPAQAVALAAAEYVPAAQPGQAETPPAEYVPAPQALHDVATDAPVYWPLGHGRQAEAPGDGW